MSDLFNTSELTRNLRDALETVPWQGMPDKWSLPMLYEAEVLSVDKGKCLCEVESITAGVTFEKNNIRLASNNADGIWIIPAVGSHVTILDAEKQAPIIVGWSEIEEILISTTKTDGSIGSEYSIMPDTIVFNKGEFGGLVKVKELTQKINNLENDINDLKSKLATVLAAITAGAGSPSTPVTTDMLSRYFNTLTPYTTSPLTPTVQSDIENTKVKH